MERVLYLDHPASTPPSDEVIDAMLPWLREQHANPHSSHRHGQHAAAALEDARASIADLIKADPTEIVFTSSATESNNLVLQGVAANVSGKCLLALSGIEHMSLLEPARYLSGRGVMIKTLPVDREGRILQSAMKEALSDKVDLKVVAIGHGNNEIGTVQSIKELADCAHESGAFVHVDASQTAGKISIDVESMGIDTASLSSHKMYGPAGIGALFVSRRMRNHLKPMMYGGGQERGLRPGTVPVFLAVGFGTAANIANRRMSDDARHLAALTDAFVNCLERLQIAHVILGNRTQKLPGLLSVSVPGIDAADLLDCVAPYLSASMGSACTAGELRASHVLRAIGLDETQAWQVVRIGFGRGNTLQDAEAAAHILHQGITKVAARCD